MLKTGQMLMSRYQAKGKGDDDADYEGCDDNDWVIVFIYFHANLPVILDFYFAILQAFAWFWA